MDEVDKILRFIGVKGNGQVNLQNIAEQGLSKTSVNRLIKNSKLPTKYILRYLGISAQALGKKSDTARFSIPVSDRVLDIAQLYVHGINALDTLNNFNQWLNEPLPVLEGRRPIELIQSHYGLKIVDEILLRIEHGIFA